MEVLHYNLDMTPESEWKIVSAGSFARDKLLYLQEAGHFISGANYYTVRKELFGYYECDSVAEAARVQAESPVVDRWNEYMKDVMLMEMDPETGAQPLMKQVFFFN